MRIDRELAAALGRETLTILDSGGYTNGSGARVSIAGALQAAVAGTCSYPPSVALETAPHRFDVTTIEVHSETTLAAAQRLVAAGERVVALNFASARRPGGGFLNGALAQEETLARSSGLFACLDGNPMYAIHRAAQDALYSAYAIYAPDVPVFRTDDGGLLDEPYDCAFISSPAPNANALARSPARRRLTVLPALRERIARVLTIGAMHGHTTILLGAWGCGAFGNKPEEVAGLFREALLGDFWGVYQSVVFAIADETEDGRVINPFRRLLNTSRPGIEPG